MKIHALVIMLAGLGLQATAPAAEHGSAGFTLDPITTIAASRDAPREPGDVGHWLAGNYIGGQMFTSQDQTGNTSRYDNFVGPNGLEYGAPFGESDRLFPALGGSQLSARAYSTTNSLGVNWATDVPTDYASASINWQRFVKLDPYGSITLSGLATLDRSNPHALSTHYQFAPDGNYNLATLTLSDDSVYQHAVSLHAWILDDDPTVWDDASQAHAGGPEAFTYSADSFGALSLTLHNDSPLPMFASLGVFAFSSVQAIPEPATALMMALGVGWLAWRTRRRALARLVPLLLATFGTAGMAHAEEFGGASFTLDPLSLDKLAPAPDAPRLPGSVGTWWTGNSVRTSLSSGHANGDNVRHDLGYTFQNGLDFSPPFGVGALQQAPLPGSVLSTEAHSGPNNLGVSWRTDLPTDGADADISWYRALKLDPFASITISGIATLTRSDFNPLTTHYQTEVVDDEHFNVATLSLRDEQAYRHEVSLRAWMLNRDPFDYHAGSQGRVASPDDFTYSADSFGVLSLTVHNNSSLPLFAAFEVLAFSSPLAAVPEPATALTMGLGIGLLAWCLRRQPPPATPRGTARRSLAATLRRAARPAAAGGNPAGSTLAMA